MVRSLNRRLSRADRWVALNVVELNSACASRRLTTNLGVGRSNRSGRAIYLIQKALVSKEAKNDPRLKVRFSLGFSLGKFRTRLRRFCVVVEVVLCPAHLGRLEALDSVHLLLPRRLPSRTPFPRSVLVLSRLKQGFDSPRERQFQAVRYKKRER